MLVTGKNGMVSSAHWLISETGIKVLRNGGNAIDASIAMALSAGVVLPDMCGIGGDAFMLYYHKQTKKLYAVNGSGEIPKRYDIKTPIQQHGMTSVTVPGCVSVLFTALDQWGTQPFEELSADAIKYAREGIYVPSKVERHMNTDLTELKKYNAANLYLNNGLPKTSKDKIVNEDYAKSLEYLNKHGNDGFYKGKLAKRIVHYSKAHGGYFELDDFSQYKCEIVEPIKINYRGYDVFQTPPVSQGYVHLQELAILNQISMEALTPTQKLHVQIEAKKIAFHHREITLNNIEEELSEQRSKELALHIDLNKANNEIDDPYVQNNGHTTSFVVVDQWGNACSFILSIAGTWGSMEVVDGTGILLNNRAGVGLNTRLGHPNCIETRKKAVHTLNTWMIFDQGKLKYVGNTPGGDYQVMWNMQMVSNLIDEKKNAFETVDSIKWRANYKNGKHQIEIEENISEEIVEGLKKMGHDIVLIPKYSASGASEIIQIFSDHLEGGCDPRCDGQAIPVYKF